MTAAYVPTPGIARIVSSTPANTNEATLFTSVLDQGQTRIVEIWVTNITGTAATATVKWGDGSTDFALISVYSIAANSYVQVPCLIPLRKNYTIKITSGTGNALTFTVVVVEMTGAGVGEHAH